MIQELLRRSVYSLTLDQLEQLKDHYDNHIERYKHLERIDNIERAIKRLHEKKDVEPAWMEFAREDKETKRKWLSSGAKWHEWHAFTIWTYKGEEFYRWIGGAQVTEEIHNLRIGNAKFEELLKRKEETQ